ncbi:hypothetical protein AKO1_010153 [Acrasis kona]|uniref:Myb-like domain-containing protein n=1 Tax=Acrasis kona TaxID=1008807 RepID=A0AAW2ZTU2_9EUKA
MIPIPQPHLGYMPVRGGQVPQAYSMPMPATMGRGMAYSPKIAYGVPGQPIMMKQPTGSPLMMGGNTMIQQVANTAQKKRRGRKNAASDDPDAMGEDDDLDADGNGKKNGKVKKKNRQRAVRHNWSTDQDEALIAAINSKKYSDNGEKIKWTKISQDVFENKLTPQSVYQRYMRVINPKLNHKEWSNAEDKKLTKLYHDLGDQWALIAKKMNGVRADVWIRQRAVKLNLIQDGTPSKKQRAAPEKRAQAAPAKKKRKVVFSSDEESSSDDSPAEDSSDEDELSEEEKEGDEFDPIRLAQNVLLFDKRIHLRGNDPTLPDNFNSQNYSAESQEDRKRAAEAMVMVNQQEAMEGVMPVSDIHHLSFSQNNQLDAQYSQPNSQDVLPHIQQQSQQSSQSSQLVDAEGKKIKKQKISRKDRIGRTREKRVEKGFVTESPVFIRKRSVANKTRKIKKLHDLFLDHQTITKHPEKYATVTIQISELLKNFTSLPNQPEILEADCTIGLFYGISAPIQSNMSPICLHSYRSHIVSTSTQPLVVRFPTNLLSFYENFRPQQITDSKINTLLLNQLFLGVQIRQAVKTSQIQATQMSMPQPDDKIIPIDNWNYYMYSNNVSTFHLFSGGFFDGKYQFQFYNFINSTTDRIQPITFEINFCDSIPTQIPDCEPHVEFTFPKVHFEALRVTQQQVLEQANNGTATTEQLLAAMPLPPLHNYVVCRVLHMKRDEERCIESMSLRWDHNCPLCGEFTQRSVMSSDNAFKYLQAHMKTHHGHMFRFYFFDANQTQMQSYYSIIATELKQPNEVQLLESPAPANVMPRELRNYQVVHPITLEPMHPMLVGQIDNEYKHWPRWEQDRNKVHLQRIKQVCLSEKDFMTRWNQHVMERGPLNSDEDVDMLCHTFVDREYRNLIRRGERDGEMKQLVMCHMYRLHEIGLLSKQQLVETLKQLQQVTLSPANGLMMPQSAQEMMMHHHQHMGAEGYV